LKYAAVLLFFTLSTHNAAAQSMVEVDMTGQPLQYSKGGNIDGCGIRIVGLLPMDAVPANMIKTFDVSVNFWRTGAALGKMIGEVTLFDVTKVGTGKRLPLYSGWMKAEGKPSAAPFDNTFKESPTDKGAYLFPVDLEGALAFIHGSALGSRVQVGLAWDKKNEWIYFGSVKLSESERNQLTLCLREALN
jgi:hypothetical protein